MMTMTTKTITCGTLGSSPLVFPLAAVGNGAFLQVLLQWRCWFSFEQWTDVNQMTLHTTSQAATTTNANAAQPAALSILPTTATAISMVSFLSYSTSAASTGISFNSITCLWQQRQQLHGDLSREVCSVILMITAMTRSWSGPGGAGSSISLGGSSEHPQAAAAAVAATVGEP
jgi:hypothetical protein